MVPSGPWGPSEAMNVLAAAGPVGLMRLFGVPSRCQLEALQNEVKGWSF
jgi:hypothetical protein